MIKWRPFWKSRWRPSATTGILPSKFFLFFGTYLRYLDRCVALIIEIPRGSTVPQTRGMGALSEALPPTFPRVRRKKWLKSAIFGNFLIFSPLRYAFCPPDASTKDFLVPPLVKKLLGQTWSNLVKLGFSWKLNSVFIKNEIDHKLRYKKRKKKKKKKIIVWLSSPTFFEKGWAGGISVFKEIWLNISLLMTKKYEKPCLKFKKPQN